MAGSITIGKGASPGYYSEQAQRGTDYYAAGAGGGRPGREPAGTWTGDGLPDLGLEAGAVVDHEAFGTIFGSHIDPRDGSRIGRPLRAPDAEQIYGHLLDADPGATAERRAELFTQAQAKAEKSRPVAFFDATFSVSKSITLLHASARAMKLAAEESGDRERAAQAQVLEDTVWAAISEGAQAGLAHLQEHAGYTRTGAGGIRQEDAHGWVVAQWKQHTSRRGDPQLHIHQTILNKVRTERDGQVRTIDGRALYRERGAAAAISTLVMENALTRELGVRWVTRADGHGREIKGISQALMNEFSSRARVDIAPELASRVDAYREQYGHDPDELALWHMAQSVSRDNREPKKDADPAQQIREWAQRARLSAGAALEPLAAQVCERPQAQAQALSLDAERDVIGAALTDLQGKRSTFTESDLTRAISEHLPADLAVLDADAAARLLPDMAARAVRGDAGMVVGLTAPDLLPPPHGLRRADGESVYSEHRAVRYATDAQLVMEQRILETAGERSESVPHAAPDAVAALLGASRGALEAQLAPSTPADVATVTGSGLHLDQAAAAFAILTSDQRASVLVGPAGTGKSRTISVIAKVWPQLHRGSRVIALTETQQGANVLRGMGVTDAHNISMFLADPRLREIPAGSLIVADEASMVTMRHLDALARIAKQNNAKLLPAGDSAQHQAVNAGGGFGMLERRLGAVRLGDALRFTGQWERDASLRLRAGDQTVLSLYDQQGRILAGTREEMLESACRRWLADYLNGKDSVLIAHDQADALDLSRRARADLVRYGRVQAGPSVRLQEGAVASAGDLIMSRRNEHSVQVANRDVWQIARVNPDGSAVVRLRQHDGTPGSAATMAAAYLRARCHLAYGRTSYDVQGSTVAGNGYAIVRPGDDRNYLYVAMSRGAQGNYAFAVSQDAQPDTGKPAPAAEVARSRQRAAEQSGESAGAELPPRSGAGVLVGVLERAPEDLSATETLEREFSDADNLHRLSRMWTDLTSVEYARRYTATLQRILGPEKASEVSSDYRFTWLCRTLRAAELAGIDGRQVLLEAAAAGSLADAESAAAVLDYRARQLVPGATPLGGSWAARAPRTGNPETDRYLAGFGAAMDARIVRLGEHAADTLPLWAERNLGTVPDDPAARQDWCNRAAAVAAYREMAGYTAPGNPIGPAPSATDPERRAAWHTALSALAKIDGIDLSGLSEGQLAARRAQYERETSQAPVHPGWELRIARQARGQATERAARSQAEARIAGDEATRARHFQQAIRWEQLRDRADAAARHYAAAMEVRENWVRFAEPTLRVAQAADLEERRRDPWTRREPLKSAEPETGTCSPGASDEDLARTLGLTFDSAAESGHPQRTAEAATAAQTRLDELMTTPEPAEDPDYEPGESWGTAAARERQAVAQPAVQLVRPAQRVADLEMEAG